MKTDKTVLLFGPTAVGKTDLLCNLFSSGYEVINADSVQVYKYLDVGSAKADSKTTGIIPHHLIDIVEPDSTFNVADFLHLADEKCLEIRGRGNTPVLSGGTAYYFKTFMYGLSEAPQSDPETRNRVALFIEKNGLAEAYARLCKVDPESGERINPNDSYRISRALEVYESSGQKLSSFKVPSSLRKNLNVAAIGLKRDKAELEKRIRCRVDLMFEQGLVEEVKKLLEMGADSSWQSMQGIGYREFFNAFDRGQTLENLNINELKEEISMNSIHYAKRQMTFFRSLDNVHWFHPDDIDGIRDFLN